MQVSPAVVKGIAVSSLGLYAGILTSSTVISITTPINILTQHLKNVLCTLGCWSTVLGGLATTAFGISYYLAPPGERQNYLLCGLGVAPLSAAYLYLVSLFNHKLAPRCVTRDLEKQNDEKLPQNHPQVKDEEAACPFSKMNNGKNLKAESERSVKCHSYMSLHMCIVTGLTIFTFGKCILDGFRA
ncbi:scm4p [Saccharomyces arboricola H-6]|uniref:Scm4p n=1 Tax=Saccharomyces arboricola (strain H-6 / AS 2.3317 / CBS 10644) TaxID=1160507 RepID=J8Q1W8_SACAR|nr:scm4p [Saccharomyces arboricola H-6]